MDNAIESNENDFGGLKKQYESTYLRTIFPDEIWEMIFDKISITDYTSLQNITNASLYFRDRLSDKRVVFLFSQVFPLFASKTDPHPKQFETKVLRQRKRPDDMLLSYNSDKPKLFLNNRLVCRSWCTGVDTYFQTHSAHYETFLEQFRWFQQICCGTNFNLSIRNADRFLDHFSSSHDNDSLPKNPFVSRSVTLRVAGVTPAGANEVSYVLEKYGHFVWYCDLFLGDYSLASTNYYKTLKRLAEQMPNLKILNVAFKPFGEPRERNETNANANPDLYTELEAEIKRGTFPKLNNLTMLKTLDLPAPIVNHILKQNKHLKMIEANISNPEVLNGSYADVYSVKLPNLTHLSITFSEKEDVLKLGEAKTGNRKLEKLHIDHVHKESCDYLSFSDVIQIIELKWSNCLTDLSLSLPPPKTEQLIEASYNQYPDLRLNFPKLRNLKLVLWNMLPLDLILPAKDSLEYLHVILHVKIVEGQERARQLVQMRDKQQVKFLGRYWAKMEQSNIWELCSRLELMNVEVFSTHISANAEQKPKISHYKRAYWRSEHLKYKYSKALSSTSTEGKC